MIDRMEAIKKIHLWLSVPFGIVITLICFSGAMMVLEPKDSESEFFRFMFRLHRWLLDPANPRGEGLKLGKLIVGVSTLLFVFVLISGAISWYPRVRGGLMRSLKVQTRKGSRAFWNTLHVAGGMYALIFLLVMALTGLTWSFGWYREAFYSLFDVEDLRKWVYLVHTGGWGGIATKILWFVSAMFGAMLPLTGYYLWIKRLRSSNSKKR